MCFLRLLNSRPNEFTGSYVRLQNGIFTTVENFRLLLSLFKASHQNVKCVNIDTDFYMFPFNLNSIKVALEIGKIVLFKICIFLIQVCLCYSITCLNKQNVFITVQCSNLYAHDFYLMCSRQRKIAFHTFLLLLLFQTNNHCKKIGKEPVTSIYLFEYDEHDTGISVRLQGVLQIDLIQLPLLKKYFFKDSLSIPYLYIKQLP